MSVFIPKTVASFETTLAAQVVEGDTSLVLTSIVDVDGNNLPAGLYAFTLDGDVEDYKEFCVGTLSGSTLSSVSSISAQGVATSGLSKYHRRGALVSLTDWVVIGRLVGVASGANGFDASAPLFYDGALSSPTGNQIPTVDYVLSVVNGGAVTFNQQIFTTQVAGENLSTNDYVYLKESDQRWWKVDLDDPTTYESVKRGFAASTQTTGNTLNIIISGLVSGFVGLTAGEEYFASSTAGGLSTTGPNGFIGVALSTTELIVDPYIRDIPTGNEKDALVGSLGAPSATNVFLTELNITEGTYIASQLTQNQTQGVGLADTTGLNNELAQSFIATKTKIRGISLYKTTNTGTFTGTVTITLQADSAGSPSGSDLATVTLTNAQWLALPNGEFTLWFASEYTAAVVGSLYWVVISTSTSDTSNHPNIRSNSAGGYADGSVKYNNTADGWTAIATIDLYFKIWEGNISQIIQTGSDGFVNPSLIPQLIGITTTAVSIVDGASAAETTLTNFQIPAGYLGTKNLIKGKIFFSDLDKDSAATLVLRLKYGATTVCTLTLPTTNLDQTNTLGYLVFELLAASSTVSQVGSMQLITTTPDGETLSDAAIEITKLMGATSGTASETSTNLLNLIVTAQYDSTNAANDLTATYSYIELIRSM